MYVVVDSNGMAAESRTGTEAGSLQSLSDEGAAGHWQRELGSLRPGLLFAVYFNSKLDSEPWTVTSHSEPSGGVKVEIIDTGLQALALCGTCRPANR